MRATNREKLRIYRWRLGQSQSAFARRHHVTLKTYVRIEESTEEDIRAWCIIAAIPLGVVVPTKAERCVLRRERLGLTQAQVASKLGRCRRWVMLMETGRAPSRELEDFWLKNR